jgi:KUP system potassium uptake protein
MAQEGVRETAPVASSGGAVEGHGSSNIWALTLGSVGVVYGDIGTSPLYALRESLAHTRAAGIGEQDVIGIVSLLVWALLLTVTLKYVVFLMRADNNGEGGTLALMALARSTGGRLAPLAFLLGILGASLFSGDAIITPAISVLSAVEGLKIVTKQLDDLVLPITVLILLALFVAQSRGTGKVAAFFGPIMLVWFATIAVLGLMHIGDAPRILGAFVPTHGLRFLAAHGFIGFLVLGSVFLAVTGAEALYADMGHFGRKPIQIAWICLVLPALVLNYLGQGALVLSNPEAIDSPFYLLAPEGARLPLVILATLAAVIASQATITGAFSLARQAIQLGLLPRLEIQHTSSSQEGQIYLPRVNITICIGVLLLVAVFKSSSALASAYGIAVTASLIVDSCLAFIVVWKLWRWPLWGAALVSGAFLAIEVAFFSANIVKFLDGGYVPVGIGVVMVVLMWTWQRGTRLLEGRTRRDSIPMADLLRMLEKSKPTRVPGTAVFLTQDGGTAPAALMHNIKHNKVLHERVVIVSVATEHTPRVDPSKRFEIEKLSEDFSRVTLHYGFMESPRVPVALASMRRAGLKFDIMTTSFFLGRRTLKTSKSSGMPHWQDELFVAMSKRAANATDFFSIPSDRVVELGAQVTV